MAGTIEYIRKLPHPARGSYAQALSLLESDENAVVAHIDSGVRPHPALGWSAISRPPEWLLLDRGRNFHDPEKDPRPIADMRRGDGLGQLLEYPDHGVKTLSALCANVSGRLVGVAPGVRVIPYRVSNGPLFRRAPANLRRGGAEEQGPAMRAPETAKLGEAIDHALGEGVRVMTISMGNPAVMGVFEPLRQALGGEVGMARSTAQAVDRAYEAGVIICCAAGQVIDSVIYPARYQRTIGVSGYDAVGTGGQLAHYPPGGYIGNEAEMYVDVWAQAMRINRAGFDLDAEPPTRPEYAETSAQGEPSGTSYATPQAAGAAALWTSWHRPALEKHFGKADDRWKIVEAFRTALDISGARFPVSMSGTMKESGQWPSIPILDIPALLDTPPDPFWPLRKRRKAA